MSSIVTDLQQEGENHSGAIMWSPRRFREAGERQVQREEAEEQEKLKKTEMKELKASNALLNKKLAEERRKQQKEKEKEALNLQKTAKQPKRGKSAASNKPAPKNKRVKKCSNGASGGNSEESPLALLPKITSRGRNITIPKKFR
ncbi:hypothetical protein EJ02DRAFT_460534 [Clathrospora elynae]|uniref:Uncharacterized protein n=1 Tax=Clathrospora elynae TaxID=706981 RepID=A0A6A5S6Z7_9PLEO|nr:hypothetical protein EJ02DRAFT_460534 [Clathrospora elynae]